MNACEKKLKKQMMALKQLKNVLLVTTLQKENYGTDAEVVAFGCMRSVVGGTLDGHLCDTCFKMA